MSSEDEEAIRFERLSNGIQELLEILAEYVAAAAAAAVIVIVVDVWKFVFLSNAPISFLSSF